MTSTTSPFRTVHDSDSRFAYLTSHLDADVKRLVSETLREDLGGEIDPSQDITASLISADSVSTAILITREAGVFCGQAFADEVFRQLGGTVSLTWHVKDGDTVTPNQTLCTLHGPSRIILTGERNAMNLIQTLSGCASKVATYVAALNGTHTQLLDTRKTIPGMRSALKYAVACGGGHNHRIGVFDAYLIKENHILACGGIGNAVQEARRLNPNKPVEVETETLAELKQAIDAGADVVMLDNFTIPMMREAVALNQGRVALEVSGNVTLDTLADYAATGVDYISVGALTKHVTALDLSMRFQ